MIEQLNSEVGGDVRAFQPRALSIGSAFADRCRKVLTDRPDLPSELGVAACRERRPDDAVCRRRRRADRSGIGQRNPDGHALGRIAASTTRTDSREAFGQPQIELRRDSAGLVVEVDLRIE